MLIPSLCLLRACAYASLSRRVNANSQPDKLGELLVDKLIKKGEC